MTITIKKSYLSRPSAAPTRSSATAGSYTVYTRRVNTLEEHTLLSPELTNVSFPNTITPQSFSDDDSHKRDEFIVYDGSDYRLVPVSSTHKGALTITSYSASWEITDIVNTQNSLLTTEDLGNFNSTSEPETVIYLLNSNDTVSWLTFSLTGLDNSVFNFLSNRLQISILGVFPSVGLSANTSYNTNFVWKSDNLNSVECQVPQFSYVKVKLAFINFPVSDNESSTYSFNLEVFANKTSYANGLLDRLNQSFEYNPSMGLSFPLITSDSSGVLKVKPFIFNNGLIQRAILAEVTINSATGSGRKLVLKPTGQISCEASSYTLLSGEIQLATLSVNASSPFISSVLPNYPINPVSYFQASTTGLSQHRLVKISSGVVAYSTDSTLLGVVGNTGIVITEGVCLVQIGGSVTALSYLQGSANGLAVSTASVTRLIALTSGGTNDVILGMFV